VAITRRTKILVAVLATPLVLLVASILFLKLYFTSERLKAIVLPKIQAAINREVTVREINLSLFPAIGVNVQGLRVANSPGAGFSERPMVSLEEFLLEVKLLPLLAKRMEVNRLTLTKPHILLEVNKGGKNNYSDFQKEEEQKTQGKKSFTVQVNLGGSLLLSNLQIRDGDIEYVDHKENSTIHLKGVDAKLSVETIAEVSEVRTESEVNIASVRYGAIERPLIDNLSLRLKEKSTIRAEEGKLTMEKGELEVQDVKLAMGGSLAAVGEKPFVDFTLRSDNIDLRKILAFIPKEVIKEVGSAEVDGAVRFDANIKGEIGEGSKPEISVDALLENGKIHYASFPRSITDINLKAKLLSSASKSTLEVTDFSAKLGENLVKMRLLLANLSDPVLDANVEGLVNLSEVKDFYPLEQGKTLSGLLRAEVSMKGKPSQPEALKGNGVIELRDVVIGSTEGPPTKASGTITFNNQVIETKGLKMTYGHSDLTLSFVMKDYLGAVFPSTSEKGKGKVPTPSINVSLASPYFESTPSKEPIVIPPFDIDATVAISKLVYNGKEPFECTDVRGSVSSSERVIRLKDLSLKVYDGNMSASGTIDLRNAKQPVFDLALDAAGADGHLLLSKATTFGDHIFGKISLTTKVKGALNDSLGLLPSTLSGDGTLHITDGKLTGYPVMDQLASFLALPELKEMSFKSWSHSFKISDGKINTPDLKIGASGNDFLVSGWQGFDGSLDYKVVVKLSGALSDRFAAGGVASQAADLLKDKEGRVMLFLVVGGSTDSPKFRWDTEAVQEKLRQKVNEEVEKKKGEVQAKTKEEVQKKLDEGKSKLEEQLKKLFKKP
jgi:uncharacterized protein involved in outer membrane biogenesis